jgi:hypothetical protein
MGKRQDKVRISILTSTSRSCIFCNIPCKYGSCMPCPASNKFITHVRALLYVRALSLQWLEKGIEPMELVITVDDDDDDDDDVYDNGDDDNDDDGNDNDNVHLSKLTTRQ